MSWFYTLRAIQRDFLVLMVMIILVRNEMRLGKTSLVESLIFELSGMQRIDRTPILRSKDCYDSI